MPWSALPVPGSAADLTAEWFADFAGFGGVAAVDVERLPGLLNAPFRVTLRYRDGRPEGPASVVVKMGGPVPGAAENQPVIDREYLFYEDLGAHLPVAVPRRLYSLAGAGGRFVLVLEDLELREGIRPFGRGDLALAVETLARRLHATYWASPELARREYLRDMLSFIERVEARLATGVPRVLGRFAETLGAGERELFERLEEGFRKAALPLVEAPATLCHHDLSGRNLFVEGMGAAREVVFIDWQLVQAVPGVRDLSFLVGCEGGELDGGEERALLARYHRGLLAEGVTGYGYERLEEDYRRSIVCDFGRVAMTASNEGLPEGMWEQLRLQLANRAGAVERWGLLELF